MIETYRRLDAELKQLQSDNKAICEERKSLEVEIAVFQRKFARVNHLIGECEAEIAKHKNET
jgi:peptidoglycan hydrolase CwlO-like protein